MKQFHELDVGEKFRELVFDCVCIKVCGNVGEIIEESDGCIPETLLTFYPDEEVEAL